MIIKKGLKYYPLILVLYTHTYCISSRQFPQFEGHSVMNWKWLIRYKFGVVFSGDISHAEGVASQCEIIKTVSNYKNKRAEIRRVQHDCVFDPSSCQHDCCASAALFYFWPSLHLPTRLSHHSIRKFARLQRRITEGCPGCLPGLKNQPELNSLKD